LWFAAVVGGVVVAVVLSSTTVGVVVVVAGTLIHVTVSYLQRGILAYLDDVPFKGATLSEKVATKAQELELSEA
jgi:hypothetical protein